MKKLMLCLSLFLLSCTSPAFARDLVIVLSPFQTKANAQEQLKTILPILLDTPLGKTTQIIDGYGLKTIAGFTVPEKKAYRHDKAKLIYNKLALAQLRQFSMAVNTPFGSSQPSQIHAVRLPQLLRFIASNRISSDPMNVLIFGSLFYEDPKELQYSMMGGNVPSDGHLLAARHQSPFGTKGGDALLKDIHMHVVLSAEDERRMVSEAHAFAVERFWSLYLAELGGELTSLSGDLSTLKSRMNNGLAPLQRYVIDPKETTLEMIKYEASTAEQSVNDRAPSTGAFNASGIVTDLEIGLSWNCQRCDLDLHALPYNGAELIYFGQKNTNEGRHYKDYLASPQSENAFEVIRFHAPVNLRQLRIAVNFYGGEADQSVRGDIRFSSGGVVKIKPFELNARSGNKGRDVRDALNKGEADNHHSLILNPASLLTKDE